MKAVLEDCSAQGVERIVGLGDIIGYGPDPRECLLLCKDFSINLMGNHEEAVLFDPIGFNPRARAAVEWTKQQLMSPDYTREENGVLWQILDTMKVSHTLGDVFLAHGTPREPTREYLFVQDCTEDPAKVESIFDSFPTHTAFVGHTHVAGVFVDGPRFISPDQLEDGIHLCGTGKSVINVGSVGQPRDGDPRSSYVIIEENKVQFRRVEYPVEETVKRFRATPLPENLALRLVEGR